MKERPIVFTGREARPVVAGVQTVLRRPMSPQPDGVPVLDQGDGKWYVDGGAWCRPCPFGVPGDILWVREVWALKDGKILYAAEGKWDDDYLFETKSEWGIDRWRSPIAMRRDGARIELAVTNVRCERVCSITEADAKANGASPEFEADLGTMTRGGALPPSTRVLGFKHAWDRRNPKAPWKSNPWAWVVSFKRVRP